MNGLGAALLGGEMASCPVCAGNSKSLPRSRCSGTGTASLPEIFNNHSMSVRLVVNNLCLLILVMDNNQSLLRQGYYCVIKFHLLYYELLSENKRINQVRNATSEAKYLI